MPANGVVGAGAGAALTTVTEAAVVVATGDAVYGGGVEVGEETGDEVATGVAAWVTPGVGVNVTPIGLAVGVTVGSAVGVGGRVMLGVGTLLS